MDAESKERGRDYLAADIFLTAARFGGDAAINRLPKETLRKRRLDRTYRGVVLGR